MVPTLHLPAALPYAAKLRRSPVFLLHSVLDVGALALRAVLGLGWKAGLEPWVHSFLTGYLKLLFLGTLGVRPAGEKTVSQAWGLEFRSLNPHSGRRERTCQLVLQMPRVPWHVCTTSPTQMVFALFLEFWGWRDCQQ